MIVDKVILIVKRKNKLLLVKRGEKNWEFPTGKVERKNSNMVHAAWRELQEKVGLYPSEMEYLGSFEKKEKNKISIFHVFLVKKFVGEIKLSKDYSDFCWVKEENITKLSKEVSISSLTVLKKFKL